MTLCLLRRLCAIGCAPLFAGCATEPVDSHRLTFATDVANAYRLCNSNEGLYCFETRPSTSQFTGVLSVSGRTLVIGANTYTYDADVRLDSTGMDFVAGHPCYHVLMRLVVVDGGARGTWQRQLDCHGLGDAGHFVQEPSE